MFLMLWGILLVLLGGWGWGYRISFRRYSGYTRFVMEGLRLQRLSPPMLYLLERGKVSRRFPGVFFKVNRAVQKICGDRRSGEFTLLFLAETLTYSWLLLTLGCVLSLLMNGDSSGLVIGAVLALLLPAALIHDLHRKLVRREHAVILELPELLNKIVLLVGAGSTVQQAIKLCLERKREQENHPLYRELFQMMREWEGGYSFQQAMEGFSKRCGIQEVSAFTTAVLLNYRRGGHDFALALRDLSHSLWEKRKAVSKTLGEQASSKLVFPMVLMFMAILLLVGAPAFMIMDL
ncbi:MAG: type II secretion system F family protein [Paenibacillus macerans]|uniref:type II secretion system F family protein n=1 Tax=Paenibacillus TaxID=44249 RepID=UPI000EC038FC|nr:type II secretion system F family protein [Paenibacillus macerans]MBS5912345.1 type II secretion system F family protein [Paenibacillus macerans]MDU5948646.1 type II secretion system F family protein [Paenibacillus macerans]MDU7474019.1 type II secretion system F family protein [Paenibacillus macerans]MEC0140318.1 type II secretion system F family protein [Paenibacillus macerans]GBK60812.1 type II secretion protein F [Paenibacillus macerans]